MSCPFYRVSFNGVSQGFLSWSSLGVFVVEYHRDKLVGISPGFLHWNITRCPSAEYHQVSFSGISPGFFDWNITWLILHGGQSGEILHDCFSRNITGFLCWNITELNRLEFYWASLIKYWKVPLTE